MLKDLLKEGGLYTMANLLTKGVSLLLIPFYTSYFTQAEYGVLGILGVFGGFVGAVISMQMYQGLGRFIAEDIPHFEKQKIGSTSFFFTSITYGLFFILAFIFKDTIIDLLSSDVKIDSDLFLLSVSAICVNALFYGLNTQLKYLRKVNQFAMASFIHSIFNILLVIFFVLKFDYGLKSVFYASIIVAPLIIMLQLFYLKGYIIFYIGKLELKKLLKFSTPLIPAAVAYLLLNLTDRFFIKEISMSANGLYEVAFKFASIISIITVAFQSSLAPILYQKHELESTKLELANVFKVFFGLGTMGVLALSLFSYETLYLFTQPEYYEAQYLIPFFYITLLITGLGMFSPGLHLMHKTKIIPFVVFVSAMINIGLNYILIEYFQLIGAAVATLISVFINSIILFVISQKLYKTPYQIKKILPALGLFVLLLVLDYFFKKQLDIKWYYAILIKLAFIGIYAVVLIQQKLVDLSKLTRTKK